MRVGLARIAAFPGTNALLTADQGSPVRFGPNHFR